MTLNGTTDRANERRDVVAIDLQGILPFPATPANRKPGL